MTETTHPAPVPSALAGTRIPRWTPPGRQPDRRWDEQIVHVPDDLDGALGGDTAALPALMLAAHLKTLAAISGEQDIVTSYRLTADGPALCCAGRVEDGSWQQLIDLAAALLDRSDAQPADRSSVETRLDLSGLSGPVPDGESDGLVLQTGMIAQGGSLALRLCYRQDVIGADFVERLAGYYLTALGRMTADPGAAHHAESLVSAAELRFQLDELSGPQRGAPDGLFVDRFEEQVRACPDAVAAAHGTRHWTYRELNERANRIAHGLLRQGLAAEDVVAVVFERNLDWLAAMLGVFKAGGVYLPIRPDFPADRVAAQLVRSRCRFAVSEPKSVDTLRAALDSAGAGVSDDFTTLLVPDAYRDTVPGDDPGVPIRPDQLAYIYFTSGSTGEPKGAMCEHAGMLNHLYAKVDDMRLRAGDVVTQIASQCFDISLWQLAAPLLVGGSTRIIDTDDQLDVRRFIDQLAAGGIHIIQVVPAYLDVMLTHLERHPSPLGELRSVSVTGEALKLELVRRWFSCYPQISLVNAYGATEVSDDTMHAVLDGVPVRDFVDVGRSLRNINTYVLDAHLRVAPLGAPGEIAFSGVCVGRGYINDAERTAQAFTEDPYRPGVRLYRTGDFGRWLPEGTIEFLGRRDEQVKIRGFRIEIGEVENRLLQMPGVATAAVVVDGDADQTKHLVAFFTGSAELAPADLRDFLAASLPDYMVPSYFHRLDRMPQTENGKVDKKRLRALAAELATELAAYSPPRTETERQLATAWAEILNVLVGRISRADDFFKLGGTSLAAVRLVVKLDGLVSLRQLVANPVLSELAAVIDAARPTAEGPAVTQVAAGNSVQLLSSSATRPVASLVCFPHAGGNAVNFRVLANALEPRGIAVYAVELPGHDVARPAEPLADVIDIAGRAHREITDVVPGPVLLWGHCAGAAHALAVARRLEQDGRPAEQVFIGALLLDDPAALQAEIDEVTAASNRDIIAKLHQERSYVELDMLKSERADLVGRAYRHDVTTTNNHLIDVQLDPDGQRLRTPLVVVVAADDPTTSGYRHRYDRWQLLAETVRLRELPDGGHYFVRTRPAEVATIVAESGRVPAVTG
ncbi:MAG TPA: amino acid adenylation domain-containing protein [Micromonosporaceae bacterium]